MYIYIYIHYAVCMYLYICTYREIYMLTHLSIFGIVLEAPVPKRSFDKT